MAVCLSSFIKVVFCIKVNTVLRYVLNTSHGVRSGMAQASTMQMLPPPPLDIHDQAVAEKWRDWKQSWNEYALATERVKHARHTIHNVGSAESEDPNGEVIFEVCKTI